jgi:hypothetical protein
MGRTKKRNHSLGPSDRPGPLGLRRPRSDELVSGPILARPPIRAIRACPRPEIGHENTHEFACVTKAESVRNKKEHWLVLTRP